MDPELLPRVQLLPEEEEQQDRRSDRHSFYGLLLTLLALGLCTLTGVALQSGWSPGSLRLVDEILTESKPLWQARLLSSWQAGVGGSAVDGPAAAASAAEAEAAKEAAAPGAVVEADHAAVASEDPRCSEIGKKILKSGGNAVDAGIATVLCMGVVNPMASGLGGGAFILIRSANGSAEFIDCRETAPAAAHQDMFEGHEEDIRKGGLSVGVPGEIAGLYLAWQRHGRLTWRDLVTPAADMAENGFHVAAYLANSLAASNATILSDPGLSAVFAPGGKLLRKGDTCYRPTLAATLKAIAEQGPDALHRGERARALVQEIQAMGGILTEQDLENFQAELREVLLGKAFGLEFLMAPPPSSGGAVILHVLKILQGYELPLASAGVLGLHRVVESLKHAFAMRMHLGDPAFVNVTDVIRDMLSDEFAARLRSAIHDNMTFPPDHYGHPEDESEEDKKRHPHRHQLYAQLDDHGTSHTCVVDQDRMAVSITSTINGPWGAGRMAVQSGIDGQLKAVVGGAGGPLIISAVLQVILHFFCRGYSPFKAIDAPRIHHQLLPNTLFYEAGHALDDGERISVPNATLAALARRNHTTFPIQFGGFVQLIVQDLDGPSSAANRAALQTLDSAAAVPSPVTVPSRGASRKLIAEQEAARLAIVEPNFPPLLFGRLTAVSDPRKDGGPAGY
ncbi:unnamed protein product [Closterium sp. Yama58-4]|nr:unnamed protein product [Closterium sp. Yama58-4]